MVCLHISARTNQNNKTPVAANRTLNCTLNRTKNRTCRWPFRRPLKHTMQLTCARICPASVSPLVWASRVSPVAAADGSVAAHGALSVGAARVRGARVKSGRKVKQSEAREIKFDFLPLACWGGFTKTKNLFNHHFETCVKKSCMK
jgi:hypothetical protein